MDSLDFGTSSWLVPARVLKGRVLFLSSGPVYITVTCPLKISPAPVNDFPFQALAFIPLSPLDDPPSLVYFSSPPVIVCPLTCLQSCDPFPMNPGSRWSWGYVPYAPAGAASAPYGRNGNGCRTGLGAWHVRCACALVPVAARAPVRSVSIWPTARVAGETTPRSRDPVILKFQLLFRPRRR